jgi:hypothetical protein
MPEPISDVNRSPTGRHFKIAERRSQSVDLKVTPPANYCVSSNRVNQEGTPPWLTVFLATKHQLNSGKLWMPNGPAVSGHQRGSFAVAKVKGGPVG